MTFSIISNYLILFPLLSYVLNCIFQKSILFFFLKTCHLGALSPCVVIWMTCSPAGPETSLLHHLKNSLFLSPMLNILFPVLLPLFWLYTLILEENVALTGVAQWIGHWPVNRKATGFDSQSEHTHGLQARSLVGGCKRQPHTDISLPLFLLPFPSKNK